RGHFRRCQSYLPYSRGPGVRHVEKRAVARQALGGEEASGGAGPVHLVERSTPGVGGDLLARNRDFANQLVVGVGDKKVIALDDQTAGTREASLGTHAIATGPS